MKPLFVSKAKTLARLSDVARVAESIDIARPSVLEQTDEEYAQSEPVREKHHTCCHNCYNSCPLWVYTEDGVAVKIEGDGDGTLSKGAICTKALNQLHLVYSPRHILHTAGHRPADAS